eukprot:Rhum_TRINITY_DN15211_c13_g1::Rhum_TRINITY_DN15211_c13_g1_i1::g.144985::m.144985
MSLGVVQVSCARVVLGCAGGGGGGEHLFFLCRVGKEKEEKKTTSGRVRLCVCGGTSCSALVEEARCWCLVVSVVAPVIALVHLRVLVLEEPALLNGALLEGQLREWRLPQLLHRVGRGHEGAVAVVPRLLRGRNRLADAPRELFRRALLGADVREEAVPLLEGQARHEVNLVHESLHHVRRGEAHAAVVLQLRVAVRVGLVCGDVLGVGLHEVAEEDLEHDELARRLVGVESLIDHVVVARLVRDQQPGLEVAALLDRPPHMPREQLAHERVLQVAPRVPLAHRQHAQQHAEVRADHLVPLLRVLDEALDAAVERLGQVRDRVAAVQQQAVQGAVPLQSLHGRVELALHHLRHHVVHQLRQHRQARAHAALDGALVGAQSRLVHGDRRVVASLDVNLDRRAVHGHARDEARVVASVRHREGRSERLAVPEVGDGAVRGVPQRADHVARLHGGPVRVALCVVHLVPRRGVREAVLVGAQVRVARLRHPPDLHHAARRVLPAHHHPVHFLVVDDLNLEVLRTRCAEAAAAQPGPAAAAEDVSLRVLHLAQALLAAPVEVGAARRPRRVRRAHADSQLVQLRQEVRHRLLRVHLVDEQGHPVREGLLPHPEPHALLVRRLAHRVELAGEDGPAVRRLRREHADAQHVLRRARTRREAAQVLRLPVLGLVVHGHPRRPHLRHVPALAHARQEVEDELDRVVRQEEEVARPVEGALLRSLLLL